MNEVIIKEDHHKTVKAHTKKADAMNEFLNQHDRSVPQHGQKGATVRKPPRKKGFGGWGKEGEEYATSPGVGFDSDRGDPNFSSPSDISRSEGQSERRLEDFIPSEIREDVRYETGGRTDAVDFRTTPAPPLVTVAEAGTGGLEQGGLHKEATDLPGNIVPPVIQEGTG